MLKTSNNTKFFLNIFSLVLIVYGIAALPPFMTAAYFDESEPMLPLAIVAGACTVCGLVIRNGFDIKPKKVRPRMNYITTIITWLIIIALTAFVYYFGRAEFSWIDSFFEATASLTTTGTGNLDVNIYPYALQLWRAELNWLGGIGLVLIAVSCLREWSFSGHALISAEVPGPVFLKSTVTFRDTYRKIIFIYIILTALHFVLLVLAGMNPFTALLTALSNISTAGLQHINNGMITQLPVQLKVIITIFAFLGSVNFSFFILLTGRKLRTIGRKTEVSIYTARILATAVIIAAAIAILNHKDFLHSLGNALMQTVSFLSTSGYIVADCHAWPLICHLIILLQMFFGACAVSTGGGIKIARVQIAFRTVKFGLFRYIHPAAVRPVRFNDKALKSDQLVSANLYITVFMLIYILGALILSLDNKSESILDALNYSQAMITNTGTSIAELDAPGLAAQFSPLSKIVMSLEMLAGRLEIYPVLMLFSKAFWKGDRS